MTRLFFDTATAALLIFVVGAIAAGLALIVRASPWPRNKARKPWSCPVCLSLWSAGSIIGMLGFVALVHPPDRSAGEVVMALGAVWLGALGLAAPVVRFVFPPPLELPPDAD